jgi:ankyrin repeat protein
MLDKDKKDFFSAIINQDLEQINKFIVDFNKEGCAFTDAKGNTLLHFASDRLTEKTLPIVQALLECGCDPYAVNEKFETALDRAKQNNNIPAMTVMKHFINKQNQELKDFYKK